VILTLLAQATTPQGFSIYATRDDVILADGTEELEDAVDALVEFVITHGIPRNRAKCWKLGDQLFELKPLHLRLIFIYPKSRRRAIVVCHSYIKQTQKAPPREIRHAERVRDQIVKAEKDGTLKYENLA
jgi:hypothetical protein